MPDLNKEKKIKVINFISGILIQSSQERKSFTFSEKEALLYIGKYRFVPYFGNEINKVNDIAFFVQIFIPDNQKFEEPVFYLEHENQRVKAFPKIIEKQYNKKTQCFSLVYSLSLREINSGEVTLYLVFPSYESKRASVKLKII